MAKTVSILVATTTLVLGKPEGADENVSVPAGEELTKDIADSVGLKKADIQDMVARGHLLPTDVRAAESGRGNDAAVVAAESAAQQAKDALAGETKRADDAEAQVKGLTADLEEAKKATADAEKDFAELEKHVETLEKQVAEQGEQIDKLTADLAEATKPADAGKGATKA